MERPRRKTIRRMPRYTLRLTGLSMVLASLWLLADHGEYPPPVAAQDNAADVANTNDDAKPRPADPLPAVGYLVRVPLPITGNADQVVKNQITRILDRREGEDRPAIIVLQFDDDDGKQTGADSEYGRSLELARFLTGETVGGVRTVAYIPQRLEGHALLVAMACQEISLGEDAELGKADSTGQKVSPGEVTEYQEVYRQRQTLPAALALGMLDPSLEVYRVDLNDGRRWILSEGLAELRDQPGFAGYETVIKAGDLGQFTAKELRSFGFVSRVVANQQELATALKVGKFSDNPALGDAWHAIQVDLDGAINTTTVSQTLRAIDDKIALAKQQGDPVNFLLLNISTGGGSAADSINLINHLEGLDPNEIRRVAYVPGLARADAAAIAFSCDEIVVHPDAVIGGSGERVLSDVDIADLTGRIQTLSEERSGHWSPWVAMIDQDRVIHEYSGQGGGRKVYLCDEELQAMADADQWIRGEQICAEGELLKVTGEQAMEMGLVDHVVENFAELKTVYGLEGQPDLVKPNWANLLIEGVRESCWLPWFLMFVGSFALMTELSSPGLGFAGFVALLCFLLFFWLKVLDGTAGALEILLFFAGITCLALEIFVIPGFGVFGLGGGAMIILSLVLASQTFVIPRNEYQLEQLPYSLFTVIAAGSGVFIGVFAMRKYIDRAPGLNRIMLTPPSSEESTEAALREATSPFASLQGKRGRTVTQLTPSGKARIGDDLVNVVSDGEAIPKETDVIVVNVQGNIVVVTSAEEASP